MKHRKTTFALIILIVITIAPPTNGGSLRRTDMITAGAESIGTIKIKHDAIVLAENEADRADNESQPAAAEKKRASESGGENTEVNSKNSTDEKPKSIKPFIPSEEIAAEQVVDFPIDI